MWQMSSSRRVGSRRSVSSEIRGFSARTTYAQRVREYIGSLIDYSSRFSELGDVLKNQLSIGRSFQFQAEAMK